MANFKTHTRYTNGNTTKSRDLKDFLVLRKALKLEPSSGDLLITITNTFIDRPDLIGFTAYGNRALWWVIFEFNNIRDPFHDLRLGQILRIPNKERVLEAIASLNKV